MGIGESARVSHNVTNGVHDHDINAARDLLRTQQPMVFIDGSEFYVLIVMLVFMAVLGTIGNAFILHVFCRKRERSSSRIFIITLAVIDVGTCSLVIPATCVLELANFKIYSDFLCKLYEFCVSSSISMSALVMAAIAVDRYLCICWSGRFRALQRQTRVTIATLGGVAAILGILVALCHGTGPGGSSADRPRRYGNNATVLALVNASSVEAMDPVSYDNALSSVHPNYNLSSISALANSSNLDDCVGSSCVGPVLHFHAISIEDSPGTNTSGTDQPKTNQANRTRQVDAASELEEAFETTATTIDGVCRPMDDLVSAEFRQSLRVVHVAMFLIVFFVISVMYSLLYNRIRQQLYTKSVIMARSIACRTGTRGADGTCRSSPRERLTTKKMSLKRVSSSSGHLMSGSGPVVDAAALRKILVREHPTHQINSNDICDDKQISMRFEVNDIHMPLVMKNTKCEKCRKLERVNTEEDQILDTMFCIDNCRRLDPYRFRDNNRDRMKDTLYCIEQLAYSPYNSSTSGNENKFGFQERVMSESFGHLSGTCACTFVRTARASEHSCEERARQHNDVIQDNDVSQHIGRDVCERDDFGIQMEENNMGPSPELANPNINYATCGDSQESKLTLATMVSGPDSPRSESLGELPVKSRDEAREIPREIPSPPPIDLAVTQTFHTVCTDCEDIILLNPICTGESTPRISAAPRVQFEIESPPKRLGFKQRPLSGGYNDINLSVCPPRSPQTGEKSVETNGPKRKIYRSQRISREEESQLARSIFFRQNVKMAAMLFIVAVVFVITYLPGALMANKVIPLNIPLFYMYFFNNVANPIIFLLTNSEFRESLMQFCQTKKRKMCGKSRT